MKSDNIQLVNEIVYHWLQSRMFNQLFSTNLLIQNRSKCLNTSRNACMMSLSVLKGRRGACWKAKFEDFKRERREEDLGDIQTRLEDGEKRKGLVRKERRERMGFEGMASKVGKFTSFKNKVSPKGDLGFRETRQMCQTSFRSFVTWLP